MENAKPWWQSKTLWGAIVTLGSGILGLTGLDLSAADREALIGLMTSLGSAIGGIIAFFGRVTAKDRIG